MHALAGQPRKSPRDRLVNLMHLPVSDAMAKGMMATTTVPVMEILGRISLARRQPGADSEDGGTDKKLGV
jgi:hypothetical protein